MLERAVSLRENHSVRHVDSAQSQEKINLLERNVAFLRSQHSDTLRQLHTELERLKKENKGMINNIRECPSVKQSIPTELNFKLVMCRCGQRTAVAARTGEPADAADKTRVYIVHHTLILVMKGKLVRSKVSSLDSEHSDLSNGGEMLSCSGYYFFVLQRTIWMS